MQIPENVFYAITPDGRTIVLDKEIDEADIPNGSVVMLDGNVYGLVEKPDPGHSALTAATDQVLTISADNTLASYDATTAFTSIASEPTLILGSTPFNEKDLKEVLQHIRQHNHTQKESLPMWNYWNILIVMVICIVTVKLVIPKINLKNFARLFVKVIYWPVQHFVKSCEKFDKEVNSIVKNTKVKK